MDENLKARHDGVLLGLLLASFICEAAAGDSRSSPDSMRIMSFRTAYDQAKLQGVDVPDFRRFAV